MKKRTYYSFQSVKDATAVLAEYKALGYTDKNVHLFSANSDNYQLEETKVEAPTGSLADIATGMIVFGALGGVFEWFMETRVFHAMEFGPGTLFPLLGILIGIAAGVFLGGLIGGYFYLGRPETNAKKLLQSGRLVLVVEEDSKIPAVENIGKNFLEYGLNK